MSTCRYSFTQFWNETEEKYERAVLILDGDKVIDAIPFEASNHDEHDTVYAIGEAYMNEHYPDYRDPSAYWD